MKFTHQSWRYILLSLIVSWVIYSAYLYTEDSASFQGQNENTGPIIEGKLVYQKYNCTACHQFYGLGGYIGPDLTNIASRDYYSSDYLAAMLQMGPAGMPVFELDSNEIESLDLYIKSMNETGYYPDYDASLTKWGMLNLNTDHE